MAILVDLHCTYNENNSINARLACMPVRRHIFPVNSDIVLNFHTRYMTDDFIEGVGGEENMVVKAAVVEGMMR